MLVFISRAFYQIYITLKTSISSSLMAVGDWQIQLESDVCITLLRSFLCVVILQCVKLVD